MLEKIGGKVVTEVQKKKVGGKTIEVVKERTEGGVLHWGNENSPDMDWFREEIKKAYGGRAPRVLDPFAGGGAIPLEAMRLGCEATAIDINPVAWFILKCTLRYPQQFTGRTWPLPGSRAESAEFMEAFQKGIRGSSRKHPQRTGGSRRWVYSRRLRQTSHGTSGRGGSGCIERSDSRPGAVLPEDRRQADGRLPVGTDCHVQECRATVPLLKTKWLCKKDNKRVLLTMEPKSNRAGLVFGVQLGCAGLGKGPVGTAGHDKTISTATMTRSGTTCPICASIMTWDDLRLAGQVESVRGL